MIPQFTFEIQYKEVIKACEWYNVIKINRTTMLLKITITFGEMFELKKKLTTHVYNVLCYSLQYRYFLKTAMRDTTDVLTRSS